MNIQKYIDKKLPVGAMVRDFQYSLVFKTTNYCWFRCPHCCENAGPHQPRQYMPYEVIRYYLAQACQDKLFTGRVVFTGGEIMSAYRFGDKSYVPTLLNMCTDAGLSVDIKTNAGWARTNFGNQIYNDLGDIISCHKKYSLQISLSLDKFHTNSIENNAAVLERLAADKLYTQINITSFAGCEPMWHALQDILRERGVRIDKMMMLYGNQERPITVLNDSVIVDFNTAQLFDSGRAHNLAGAKHTEFPQFKFLSPDRSVLMAFDTSGRVTLGENSGRKISTKWDAGNEMIYQLPFIRDKLVRNAKYEEIRARLLENWRITR